MYRLYICRSFLTSKIILFLLFHRQNFVVPTEHEKEIKYIDARSETAKTQTSDTGITIFLFFAHIGFLLFSLKHEKFYSPVNLFLDFPKSGSHFHHFM